MSEKKIIDISDAVIVNKTPDEINELMKDPLKNRIVLYDVNSNKILTEYNGKKMPSMADIYK